MQKILVIDDSPTIRESLVFVLEKHGYGTEQAVNGREGFEKFKSNREDYAMAFVDWNMPEMNGLGFIQNARKISRDIPIVLLTTETDQEKIKAAKESHANAWLIKPFVEADLIRIVKLLVK